MTFGFFIHSCVVEMMTQDKEPVSSGMWVSPVRFEASYDNLDWSIHLDPIQNRGVRLKWGLPYLGDYYGVLFSLCAISYHLPFCVKNNKDGDTIGHSFY